MAKVPARKRIRIDYVPVESLQPADYNPRLMLESDMAKLQRSLAEWGVVDPVIVRRENGEVVGGHQRLEAAKREGLAEVPVVYLDGLSDQQAKLLNVALNKISGEWDMPKLGRLLLELGDVPELDLSMSGFDPAERTVAVRAYQRGQPGLTDDDAVPEAPEPITKPGDLWLLGEHRLLCGDATKAEDVGRVLGGGNAEAVVTDPPYCSGGFQEAGKKAGSVGTRGHELVHNDQLSTRGYMALMKAAIGLAPVGVIYVFTDWRMWVNLFDVAESSGFGVRNMIVWDKGSPGMGVGWRSQHELIMCASRVTMPFDPKKAQGNVVQVKRTGNVEHPTEKPTELITIILEVTDMANGILDPFLGSGTTMIACEKLGRRCYGMEIEPRYVDVAVKRWEEFTGREGVRDAS